MFIWVSVSSTVTLIAGKAVKYIHLCMLMCVEMDFNLVQVKTFVVYWYIYIYLTDCFCIHFMFTLFCAQNWFVFDANFNSPNNKDGLFLEYQIILASCLRVQINSIKSNKEINCSEIQNSQRYMYSVNSFYKSHF